VADSSSPGLVAATYDMARDRGAPLRAFLRTESGSAGILVAGGRCRAGLGERRPREQRELLACEVLDSCGDLQVTRDVRTWINSGLMTLFFLVVGLEARREFDLGDLRERRRFVLPFVAGLAGMAIPVAIYLAVNTGHASAHGWGVAMSTEALALGLLSAARSRGPGSGAGLLADRLRCV
jgi:Na+/H+ antiporter NhaA